MFSIKNIFECYKSKGTLIKTIEDCRKTIAQLTDDNIKIENYYNTAIQQIINISKSADEKINKWKKTYYEIEKICLYQSEIICRINNSKKYKKRAGKRGNK